MPELRIPAIEFNQRSTRLYIFSIPAEKLIKLVRSRFRTSDDQEGIQRFLDKKRISEIAAYASDPSNTIPNNIIINFTKDVTIERTNISNVVMIILPNEEGHFGDIIDGQHRLYGITNEKSRYPELEIAVTGLMIKDPKSSGKVFADINSKQKPVSASLLVSLQSALGALPEIETIAAGIMERLNDDDDSPLKGQIKMFQDQQGKLIRNDQIIKVIKGILQPDKMLHAFIKNLSSDTALGILKTYLSALEEMFPDAWNDSRNYLLTRSAGLSIILGLFDRVFQIARFKKEAGLPTKEDFRFALEPIRDAKWDTNFFKEGRFTSAIGISHYRNNLLDKLPPPGL